jgi:hypothetical protein
MALCAEDQCPPIDRRTIDLIWRDRQHAPDIAQMLILLAHHEVAQCIAMT